MNGPSPIPREPVWVPAKMATITFGSMALVIRPMASAMLMTNPVLCSMARIPAAIPRFAGGTTPITALVLGELKSPAPAPITSCQMASCQ